MMPRRERQDYTELSNLSDISVALISPGFSKQIMNDQAMRENLRRSLTVKDKQRDLIQRRLQDQVVPPPPPTSIGNGVRYRKTPSQLDLSKPWSRKIASAQTAPIYGSFSQYLPSPWLYHKNSRNDPRGLPYQRRWDDGHIPLKNMHPLPQQTRMTPPQSGKRFCLPSLIRNLPPSPPRSSHEINMIPRDDNGLDTLSRAARLKCAKEEYLRACSESFDAFHGISYVRSNMTSM